MSQAGGDSTLINAVSGDTPGGTLKLTQTAVGGANNEAIDGGAGDLPLMMRRAKAARAGGEFHSPARCLLSVGV